MYSRGHRAFRDRYPEDYNQVAWLAALLAGSVEELRKIGWSVFRDAAKAYGFWLTAQGEEWRERPFSSMADVRDASEFAQSLARAVRRGELIC